MSLTYLIIPLVEPAKSLAWITSGGHSGCAIIFIPGLFFLISFISASLNCSCTSQVPFQEIISWQGTCIVHEKFTGKEVENIKKENPDIKIIAHPECPPDVISASDFAGSTSSMVKYVKEKQPKKVLLVTECSMSDNVQADNPNVQFIKPCNLCPHMKKITLNKVYECLKNETNEIKIGHNIAEMARKSVLKMAEIGR